MNKENIILIDAHVHIHDCFDINLFLDSSYKNFEKTAEVFNARIFDPVLCLTENHNANWFNKFRNKAESTSNTDDSLNWKFHNTSEPNSIRLSRNQYEIMYIIAGRQIITKERLEVLGIGLTEDIDDGKPLEEVVQFVKKNNSLPVIPWGAGKWTGTRKKTLNDFVTKYKNSSMFLGDNSNRPFFWPKSSIFTQAERLNIRNLPGTDPLPFKSEASRAGKYGFAAEGQINPAKPYEEIKRKVLDLNTPLLQYGKQETVLRFFRNQFLTYLSKQRKFS